MSRRGFKWAIAIAALAAILLFGKVILFPFLIDVIQYRIFEAATVGDVRSIERLLELWLPINVNAKYGGEGASALHRAATHANTTVVLELLAHGADVDEITDQYGETALQIASYYGNVGVVKILLERCANPNIQDLRYHNYPLYDALNKGHPDVATLLLSSGANPDLRRADGSTARQLMEQLGIGSVARNPFTGCGRETRQEKARNAG